MNERPTNYDLHEISRNHKGTSVDLPSCDYTITLSVECWLLIDKMLKRNCNSTNITWDELCALNKLEFKMPPKKVVE